MTMSLTPRDSTLQALSTRFKLPLAHVKAVFDQEHRRLAAEARITTFTDLLALTHTKWRLGAELQTRRGQSNRMPRDVAAEGNDSAVSPP